MRFLALPAAAERPYIGVGRIIPSPPTQPFIGAVQHVVGGKLGEDRHTKELMPEIRNDKNTPVEFLRLYCGASVTNGT